VLSEGEWTGIALGIIAILVAIIVPFVIERWRRPHLIISRNEEIRVPGETTRFLHGTLTNQPHLHILRWIERFPAYDTRVRLTFNRDGQRIFNPVETKWSAAPECRRQIAQILINQPPKAPEIRPFLAFDETVTIFAHTRTIPADREGQLFDIIIKNQGTIHAMHHWLELWISRSI
jgi:hypothetical protein